MGVKSSRKLAGAGGEGGSETITAAVPLTFLGWGHSDFELLLCIWLAHWEPCKLRQMGDQVRKENAQVINSLRLWEFIILLQGLWKESWGFHSLSSFSNPQNNAVYSVNGQQALADCLYFSTCDESSLGPHRNLKVHEGLIRCGSSRGSAVPMGRDHTLLESVHSEGEDDLCLLAVSQS